MWKPIAEAPRGGYIIVAIPYGSKWVLKEAFLEYDEWIDVNSDEVLQPTHFAEMTGLPTT